MKSSQLFSHSSHERKNKQHVREERNHIIAQAVNELSYFHALCSTTLSFMLFHVPKDLMLKVGTYLYPTSYFLSLAPGLEL